MEITFFKILLSVFLGIFFFKSHLGSQRVLAKPIWRPMRHRIRPKGIERPGIWMGRHRGRLKTSKRVAWPCLARTTRIFFIEIA